MVKLVSNYIEECDHVSWYNKVKEIIWYLFFGFLTTIVNIGTFIFLDKMGVNLYLNNFIAWVMAVLFAFFTNKFFVFTSISNKNIASEIGKFFLARIISLGIEMLGLFIFIEMFDIMCIIVVIVNYIFSKLFVFKKNSN